MTIQKLLPEDFRSDVLKNKKPSVVALWSCLSPDCFRFFNDLAGIEDKFGESVDFYLLAMRYFKRQDNLPEELRCSQLPACVFFKKGNMVGILEGQIESVDVEAKVRELLLQ